MSVCPGVSFLITAGKYVDVVARNFVTAIYAKVSHFAALATKRSVYLSSYLSLSHTYRLSSMFVSLLQDVGKFGDLALATITLANVILKTEEIYLLNHIKLYLKNNPTAAAAAAATTATTSTATTTGVERIPWQDEAPSTSSAAAAARAATSSRASSSRSPISEISYFAKVLSEKLLGCLDALLGHESNSCSAPGSMSSVAGHAYCQLASRFVNALHNVCCRSRHKDALQSVFRLVLAESEFLCKYYNLLLMSVEGGAAVEALEPVLLACLQLLLSMRMLEPMVLLDQAAELPLKWSLQRAMLDEVCRATVVSEGHGVGTVFTRDAQAPSLWGPE